MSLGYGQTTESEGKTVKDVIEIGREESIRGWVEKKSDSRWKDTVLRFLDYLDGLHFDPRMDKKQKLALMMGCRESLRKITHPHHTSTSGLHMVLDVIDERLNELGYSVPEDCGERWGI